MKKIFIVSLLVSLFTGNAFANTISVPFMHKAVPPEGLIIHYNTHHYEKSYTNKVVCIADNFLKGWVVATVNGVDKELPIVFGNMNYANEFYFTSTESDIADVTDEVSQFHVDDKGYIKFMDSTYKPHTSYVSCFYIPEKR